MKCKSRKGYSLIETTVSILLISMAAIIIITGAKAGLSGYIEGRKIHTINERLMVAAEKDISLPEDVADEGKNKISREEEKDDSIINAGGYEFTGKYKTYTDTKTGMTYKTFE